MQSPLFFTWSPRWCLAAIAAIAMAAIAPAQQPNATDDTLCPAADIASLYSGPFLERQNLTGDWYGYRSELRDRGITFDLSTTQFYQGITRGGLDRAFLYGGRNDYFVNMDGEKLGFWKGSHVTLHAETRYGQTANDITGALVPVNLMLAEPRPYGTVTALTDVRFTQYLSENLFVYAGKINTLDDFVQPLTGARGLNGFLNTALIFNPVQARTLPYSTFGTGFVYLVDGEPLLTLSVFDTNNTPTISGFETFFNNGVTILAESNFPTTFFGLPGHQGLSGTYSNGKYTSLQPAAYLDPILGPVIQTGLETGSWSLIYNFDQALSVSSDDPKRMWGVFGNLGIADDNPSPVRWVAIAGVSGASPIRRRAGDTFGIGYFYMGVSEPLKNLVSPFASLRNEQGVEVYYNIAVTPWCHITPDFQVMTPFQDQVGASVLFGLRAKIDF